MFIVPFSQLSSIFPAAGADAAKQTQQVNGSGVPFVDMLRDSIANMQDLRAVSDKDSVDLALGNTDDLHTMGINAARTSVATTFTTQLATRALNAYNEIIRIQV